jgi:hypothetical protein
LAAMDGQHSSALGDSSSDLGTALKTARFDLSNFCIGKAN